MSRMFYNRERRRVRSRCRRGVTMVEVGICVSIFLVLLLAIIQYAVIMANVVAVNHVARSTARFAAQFRGVSRVWPGGLQELSDHVRHGLVDHGTKLVPPETELVE